LAFVAQLSASSLGAQDFDVVIEPQQIVFNLDEDTPTVELSLLVTGPRLGQRLFFSIDVPQGIDVAPSRHGQIVVGQRRSFRLILRDASTGGPSIHVSISDSQYYDSQYNPPAFGRDVPVALVAAATPVPLATPTPLPPPATPMATPTPTARVEPPLTTTPGPTKRDVTAYWNQWATDWQGKRVTEFDAPASNSEDAATSAKRVYRFYADLSGIDLSPVHAVKKNGAGPVLETVLSLPDIKLVTLQILPTVEGDGVRLASKGGWQKVMVVVDKLRDDSVPTWQTEIRREPTDAKFAEIVQAASALRDDQGKEWRPITVDLRAIGPGCAAVALSIWNEDLSQPLDQVAWPVSVGGEPCKLQAASDRTLSGALLDRFGAPSSQKPSAALHVFELTLNEKPAPVAVFAVRGQPEPRHWPLKDLMSDVVSRSLQTAVEKARKKNGYYGYKEVSAVLEEVLFPAGEGSKALEDIKQLAKSAERPVIYARVVTNDGLSVALPLGLLDVGKDGPLGRYVRILSPLKHERVQRSKGCVDRWAILAKDATGELPERMRPAYTDWPAAKGYLRERCESVGKDPEAVFILAHHPTDGSEAIGYDASETLTVSGLTRCYPQGSIGIFFLCQFENPKPSRVPLTSLEAFNRNGLDAAIASPFSLAEAFAKQFLAALGTSVGGLAKRTSLADLFDATVKELKDKNDQKAADEAFELVLIGDPNLPICGRGNE
jgi:hypothetical protein